MPPVELRRIVGPGTTYLMGLGVAVGSGIFRTPGLVAHDFGAPAWILGAWMVGGLVSLAQSLVQAELATRCPKAGGEYAILHAAYGPGAAFLFGYGSTIFILGGGLGTLAVALGEATTQLLSWPQEGAASVGALAIVLVATVNALGLRTGARFSNGLTLFKLVALLGVGVAAFWKGPLTPAWNARPRFEGGAPSLGHLLGGLLPVLWTYDGSTDAIKLAEEIKDVERTLPRVLVASSLSLMALYGFMNTALLHALSVEEVATSTFAASDAMARLVGASAERAMHALVIVVLLATLSSTLLTTVRVTFALARDGFLFATFGRMSPRQAPIAAMGLVSVIGILFTLVREFRRLLDIYFLASALLFGLTYGSLLVFRARERHAPLETQGIFRCPFGPWLAGGLVLFQGFLAIHIVQESPGDSALTLGLLAIVYGVYGLVRRRAPQS